MRLYATAYVLLFAILWAASAFILTACTGAPLMMPVASDAPVASAQPSVTVPKLPCPQPDQTWTPDEFKALAKALGPFKDDPVISKENVEWMRLRRESTACIKSQN